MSDPTKSNPPSSGPVHFIREIVEHDRQTGRFGGRVATRFPPEPNGYLHIGHAKSICLNFGLARENGGTTNLRFDDTNPVTEDVEYVESIQEDIAWLGFKWDSLHFASDYFAKLYDVALVLIRKGLAYVDSETADEIKEHRGDYYRKGVPSRYRDRTVEENLDLFARMKAGEFPDGAHVVRAKIDLDSQNMNLRDPILYRIKHAAHHRTGTEWCIYPMYDYAHPLSDAFEQITHSICTLEFEAHRPLYDWCIREAEVFPSQQIEFARLKLTYTVMSKRKFIELVDSKRVDGWDDPRMPTLAGLRRRGIPAAAIRNLCERVGVAKADSTVDYGLLEHCVREELNRTAPRALAVLRPLELVIDNLPDNPIAGFEAPLSPEDPTLGTRVIPFGKRLYIEREDFREDPPKDWFRLAPGREVRLRYACLVTCVSVDRNAEGEPVRVHCTWDPKSIGGTSPDGRTVKGTLHWVSAEDAIPAEVRLYDRLFTSENPGSTEGVNWLDEINPRSLEKVTAYVEPHLKTARPGSAWQFERVGYFSVDKDSREGALVFNRTVTLKDTWAKIEAKSKAPPAAKTEKDSGKKVDKVAKPVDKKPAEKPAAAAEIAIEDFAKLDLRVGIVRTASLVEGSSRLIRLEVDVGEGRLRNIFAGVRAYYPDPAPLVGKRVIVVANLKPREMKWGTSEGMVLAAGGPPDSSRPHFLATVHESAQPGDKIS